MSEDASIAANHVEATPYKEADALLVEVPKM